MKGLIKVKDIPWAAARITRKASFEALRVLPLRTHMEIALLRGRVSAPISGIPAHVRDNMHAVLGQTLASSEVDDIARKHVQFLKRAYIAKFLPLLRDFDRRTWRIEGLEHLDEALAYKRGAILATAHLGYPRLIAPILRARGYEVVQVVDGRAGKGGKRAFDELLASSTRFRRWMYERTRIVVYRGNAQDITASLDVRPIFEALSRNQVVMIVGDGMRAVGFARLSLLGRICPFPTGFMKIAMLTGAPLLPVFVVDGDRRNRLRVEIHPPLGIEPGADVGANLKLFADAIETRIQKTPYLWNRWKTKNLFEKAMLWSESEIRRRYDDRWNRARSDQKTETTPRESLEI